MIKNFRGALLVALLMPVGSLPCLAQAGGTWNGLSGADADIIPVANASAISAVTDGNARPYIAWTESGRIRITHWDGTAWGDAGGAAFDTAGASSAPVLVYDRSGALALAWLESDAGGLKRIRVANRVLTTPSSSWTIVGPASGVHSSMTAGAPSIARWGNEIAVAWAEEVAGVSQVYAKFSAGLDATPWIEKDGSASGSGLSRSFMGASQPTVGYEDAEHYWHVAWVERDDWNGNGGIRDRGWRPNVGWAEETSLLNVDYDGIVDDHSAPQYSWTSGHLWVLWTARLGGERHVFLKTIDSVYGGGWEELAGSGSGTGITAKAESAGDPRLSFLPGGRPVVTWIETSPLGARDVYVRTLGVGSWIGLDGSASGSGLSGTGAAVSAAIVCSAVASPLVIWTEDAQEGGTPRIVVRQQSPSWHEYDGSGTFDRGLSMSPGVNTGSTAPAIAMDADGHPIVAWAEKVRSVSKSGLDVYYPEIYVRRWDGSAWTGLGTSDSGGGISMSPGAESAAPAIAVDALGRVVVAWEEYIFGNREVYVKRWNGSQWLELAGSATNGSFGGGVSVSAQWSREVSLALDPSGNPVVAWTESSPVYRYNYTVIRARRFNGSAWVSMAGAETEYGVSGQDDYDARYSSLAVSSSGQIFLAWCAVDYAQTFGEIRARTFDVASGTWGTYGGTIRVNPEKGIARRPVTRFNPQGVPVVAWEQDGWIQVVRWDGGMWWGYGDDRRKAVSGDRPALAFDGSGFPIVASAYKGVLVVRWDLDRWVGVGAAQYSPGASYAAPPAPYTNIVPTNLVGIAVDPLGDASVVWTDDREVYFRHYMPALPAFERAVQRRANGSLIPPGGIAAVIDGSGAATVVIEAVLADPDDRSRLEVQLIEAGQDESAAIVSQSDFMQTGTKVSLSFALPLEGNYRRDFRWRARATDRRLQSCDWVEFNITPAVDVVLRDDSAPEAGAAGQYRATTGWAILPGDSVEDLTPVQFRVDESDADGDPVRVIVKLVPVGVGGGSEVLMTGELAAPGAPATATALLPRGDYRWEFQLEDEFGMTGPWTSFTPAGGADLRVGFAGSSGARGCGGSATTGMATLAVLLAAGFVRRRA